MENEEGKSKKITVLLVMTLISLVCGCISYFYIEGQIPIQWDIHWNVSNYAPREYVFLMSAFPLIIYILMSLKGSSTNRNNIPPLGYKIITYAITYLLIACQWLSISAALNKDIEIRYIIPFVAGIALMVIGNFLPTVRMHCGMGLIVPRIDSNIQNIRKVNRFMGYSQAIAGFLFVLYGALQIQFLLILTVIVLAVTLVSSYFYAFRLSHKQK